VKVRSREMSSILRQEVGLGQVSLRKGFHCGSLLKILDFFKLVINFVINIVRCQVLQARNFENFISQMSLSG
jgi:hypothetical protein